MGKVVHTREDVLSALAHFLTVTGDLCERSWKDAGGPMSSGVVSKLMGARNFSFAVVEFASQNAPPDVIYVWPLCPNGVRHQRGDYFQGTRGDFTTHECPKCVEKARRSQSYPTFKERWPHLVAHLTNPADAETRFEMVAFTCSVCGDPETRWSPKWQGTPCCPWCRAYAGHSPGDVVQRTGGGDAVQLEKEVARALANLHMEANTDLGILLPKGAYHVPVIKPDILLPNLRVAVEIDNARSSDYHPNRHSTQEGAEDDVHRDSLLNSLGWRALRCRLPGQPTVGSWPWRVETTTQSPTELAHLIRNATT